MRVRSKQILLDSTITPSLGTVDIGSEASPLQAIYSSDYIGNLTGAIRFKAKNETGNPIAKGVAVYINGLAGTGDVPTVDLADADLATAMPAVGLTENSANNNAEVYVVSFGNLTGLNTSTLGTVGQSVYIDTTAGALTTTPPAGATSKLQNIGQIVRVHATDGIIKVGGAGRTAATPNLDQGHFFLGNASDQSEESAYTLPVVDGTINQVLQTDGNNSLTFQTLNSDDITSDHTGVNYTGALNGSITDHLLGIDNALANASSFVIDDVNTATNLQKNNFYQTTNVSAITHTLPLTANSTEGETIKVARGLADGLVTVQQNAGDAGTKIYSSNGFASTFKLTRRGEVAEFVYDATDSLWRVINEKTAYIPTIVSSSANPIAIDRPTFYFLNAANQGTINLTLPAYSNLSNGDKFEFMVEVDRDLEINVNATDSGNIPIIQNSTNNGDQLTVSLVAGQTFTLIVDNNQYRVIKELGNSSIYNVGTSANNIVQLDSNARLPAVDGSALTGINSGGKTFSRQNQNFTADVNHHYSIDTTNQAVIVTLPALSTLSSGDEVRFYFRDRPGTNNITINVANASGDLINDLSAYTMDVEYESITLIANTTDSIWELI